MTRKACSSCPFRIKSQIPYCDDGHDALQDGHEPSCHAVVGAGNQFDDPMPDDDTICAGYVAWINDNNKFSYPKRIL